MDSSSGLNKMEMRSEQSPVSNAAAAGGGGGGGERKARPQPEQALKCPRCDSGNTKFCYYNNYSLTQPRYFCKACRRYWTKGGTLRNVPVGGGCRKNRRPSSSSSSSSSSAAAKRAPHDHLISAAFPPPAAAAAAAAAASSLGCGYDQNDLALAFSRLQKSSLGFDLDHHHQQQQHQQQQQLSIFGNMPSTGNGGGFLDALRSGFLDSSTAHSSTSSSTGALYFGYNNNNNGMGGYDDDNNHNNDQIAHQDHQRMMIKNELCNGNDHNSNNRVLWGCPWQLNAGSSSDNGNISNMVDFDGSATTPGREIWNGFASSWHGLLNTTPLM